MSGGAFNYNDYHIRGIADQIEEIIRDNEDRPVYDSETISRFRDVMVHRIDWLISGDDGEDTFHRRLPEDLERLEREE
jgi:hypothetical protein